MTMAVDLELLVTAAKGPAAMAASRTARRDVADMVVDTVTRAKRHLSEDVDATFLQPGRLEALRAVPPLVAVGTWPTVLRRSKEPEADPKAREKAELAERKHWGAELPENSSGENKIFTLRRSSLTVFPVMMPTVLPPWSVKRVGLDMLPVGVRPPCRHRVLKTK